VVPLPKARQPISMMRRIKQMHADALLRYRM